MIRYIFKLQLTFTGVAKVRKEASFRERKVPFAKGRFWLPKEENYKKIFLKAPYCFNFNVCFKRNSSKLMLLFVVIHVIYKYKNR